MLQALKLLLSYQGSGPSGSYFSLQIHLGVESELLQQDTDLCYATDHPDVCESEQQQHTAHRPAKNRADWITYNALLTGKHRIKYFPHNSLLSALVNIPPLSQQGNQSAPVAHLLDRWIQSCHLELPVESYSAVLAIRPPELVQFLLEVRNLEPKLGPGLV